ncbi:MBL fold metallo-hydrolase [Gordonia iterans]
MATITTDRVPTSTRLTGYRLCCQGLLSTPFRLARPRRPDRALRALIVDAGLRRAAANVRLSVLPQARKTAPTSIVAEGVWRPRTVALGDRAFLIEHPRARFLVDPALCHDVHESVLPELPLPLRLAVRPEREVLGLADALGHAGLCTGDIDFVLPTHLHWDHISGVLELPGETPLHISRAEHSWVTAGGGRGINVPVRPLAGRDLTPYELDGPPVLTFERSHDLFGDGAVVLVDMAGHTPGSVGVLLALDDGSRVLLVGDAVWHTRQVTEIRQKAPFPGMLADSDRTAAFATIHRIHALPPGIHIVPSHDRDASTRWIHPAFRA